MAVSTFYGSNADAMHMDMLTRLHGEVVSVSGSSASQINDTTTVEGFGQNMALKRRGYGHVYLLRKHCGRYAYGHVSEATWGSG
ncbi:hypothetical protein GN958_ATG10226 [Phytophthora infestans]|uniref:Uncharacterized protein n=1 Tax=Phytophthora infestans TaxID=4787 RepID=A0A8S9U2X5_PHYIN|nr:hypothetical protein GN958_ATG16203 [Phytophthora infestans]KAF4140596.1 hypothetical protein GN958_ATG10226 [Phytophthora infestans]